jgi:hypothetical protein
MSNALLMIRGSVGNDDYAYPRYSTNQRLPEGKVTVTLDNIQANGTPTTTYGTMFLEFTI